VIYIHARKSCSNLFFSKFHGFLCSHRHHFHSSSLFFSPSGQTEICLWHVHQLHFLSHFVKLINFEVPSSRVVYHKDSAWAQAKSWERLMSLKRGNFKRDWTQLDIRKFFHPCKSRAYTDITSQMKFTGSQLKRAPILWGFNLIYYLIRKINSPVMHENRRWNLILLQASRSHLMIKIFLFLSS
jgi:hypothetical protein